MNLTHRIRLAGILALPAAVGAATGAPLLASSDPIIGDPAFSDVQYATVDETADRQIPTITDAP